MSETPSNQPPANIGANRPVPTTDPPSTDPQPGVIESVQEELQKGGVGPEKAARMARVIVTRLETFHSGPLPPVSDFAGYEQICPGAARDILEMAKSDLAHHQSMERWHVIGDLLLKVLGLLSAIAIVGGMLAAALYAALNGHDGLAVTIASGTGLSMVAGVFVRARMTKRTQPQQQPQQQPRKGKRK